jgi:hypothetical protein
MPVKIDWYDVDKTILLVMLSGRWTWEELYHQQDEFNLVLDALTHDVDVIARSGDAKSANSIPFNSLTQMLVVVRRTHPRIRSTVLMTQSGLWSTIDTLMRRISPLYNEKIIVARDEAEALARIMARRTQAHPA